MEELSNLLRLKEENRLLKEENTLVKTELKTIKGRFNDSISMEKTSLKVIELKMLLEKKEKKITDLQQKILDAENFADKRNEEILSAIVNGSYGISFEDFILNLSETTFLKIPLDAIFNYIKEKDFEKYNTFYKTLYNQKVNEIKKEMSSVKLKTETKINSIKKDHKREINSIKQDHDRKINSIKQDHEDQILLLNTRINSIKKIYKDQISLLEDRDPGYLPILKRENANLKKEKEENSRSREPLEISMNILKSENSGLQKDNHNLSVSLGRAETKLQNCQKELSKYLTKSNFNSIPSISKSNIEDINMGINSDGSKGWHDIARETGKFGSLPSFDNYDDDYLDNSKEGFE